jgi:hypothetical protein
MTITKVSKFRSFVASRYSKSLCCRLDRSQRLKFSLKFSENLADSAFFSWTSLSRHSFFLSRLIVWASFCCRSSSTWACLLCSSYAFFSCSAAIRARTSAGVGISCVPIGLKKKLQHKWHYQKNQLDVTAPNSAVSFVFVPVNVHECSLTVLGKRTHEGKFFVEQLARDRSVQSTSHCLHPLLDPSLSHSFATNRFLERDTHCHGCIHCERCFPSASRPIGRLCLAATSTTFLNIVLSCLKGQMLDGVRKCDAGQ